MFWEELEAESRRATEALSITDGVTILIGITLGHVAFNWFHALPLSDWSSSGLLWLSLGAFIGAFGAMVLKAAKRTLSPPAKDA